MAQSELKIIVRRMGDDTGSSPKLVARNAERDDVPFRAPHYSCSPMALRSELALAMGGVLYLEEPERGNVNEVALLLGVIAMAHESFQPTVFLSLGRDTITSAKGCEILRLLGPFMLHPVQVALGHIIDDMLEPEAVG